jgi:hypothetical protein
VQYADPDEVRSFAGELPDNYLHCRTLGHAWTPHRAQWRPDEGAYWTVYLCPRCDTQRVEWLDEFGDKVRGNYAYEDGYQHKGMGRITGRGRSMLRLEELHRIIDKPKRRTRKKAS